MVEEAILFLTKRRSLTEKLEEIDTVNLRTLEVGSSKTQIGDFGENEFSLGLHTSKYIYVCVKSMSQLLIEPEVVLSADKSRTVEEIAKHLIETAAIKRVKNMRVYQTKKKYSFEPVSLNMVLRTLRRT